MRSPKNRPDRLGTPVQLLFDKRAYSPKIAWIKFLAALTILMKSLATCETIHCPFCTFRDDGR